MIDLKKGLSGCEVILSNDSKSINKISSSPAYNVRLRNQIKKQSFFSKIWIEGIRVPEILKINETTKLSFEMEYISGISPIELFSHGSPEFINKFLKNLKNFIDKTTSLGKIEDINILKILIKKKLEQLRVNSVYTSYIDYLIKKIESIESKVYVKSICHGDFTINNMIVQKNNLFLIDFLDSYIDSPLVDLMKLKQDLIFPFLLDLNQYNKQDIFRIKQVSEFIWSHIQTTYNQFIETLEFKIIESLNFLRIEPYITEEKRFELEKIIKSLSLYEEFNNTNVW